MRIPLVAGNWKMHKTVTEARHMVSEMVPGLQSIPSVEKVICPPFTAVLAVSALLEGTDIRLGAQNLHWETAGAFTGEISPAMVKEFCQFVVIGHSERRAYFGETDESVNRKIHAAVTHGLIPILCVGETLDENEADRTYEVVFRQIKSGLAGLEFTNEDEAGDGLVVAYEPVWAIGTGRAATPTGANEVIHQVIRPALEELFGERSAQSIRVLYGGSVNSENARDFFKEPDIDGALVGGASLKVSEFIQIAQAAMQ
jgi:triosephosphate isomerase